MALEKSVLLEINALPCTLLGTLPEAFAVWTRHAHLGVPVLLQTALRSFTGESDPNAVVFHGDELVALAVGVASERFQRADFERVCLEKVGNPGLRLNLEAALAGAYLTSPVPSVTLGAMLSELGLEPLAVRLESECQSGELAQAA